MFYSNDEWQIKTTHAIRRRTNAHIAVSFFFCSINISFLRATSAPCDPSYIFVPTVPQKGETCTMSSIGGLVMPSVIYKTKIKVSLPRAREILWCHKVALCHPSTATSRPIGTFDTSTTYDVYLFEGLDHCCSLYTLHSIECKDVH